jgi:hypothetical protein
MKKYSVAEKAPEGVYMNLSTWEFVQVGKGESSLPGGRDASYVKVPAALAVLTGPFAGLVFIIFLPFVGIAGFLGFLGYKIWNGIVGVQRRTVENVAMGWEPGRANLTKGGGGADEEKVGGEEPLLKELEDEINKRKDDGEE